MRDILEWIREIEVTLEGGFVWLVAALVFIGVVEVVKSIISLF